MCSVVGVAGDKQRRRGWQAQEQAHGPFETLAYHAAGTTQTNATRPANQEASTANQEPSTPRQKSSTTEPPRKTDAPRKTAQPSLQPAHSPRNAAQSS